MPDVSNILGSRTEAVAPFELWHGHVGSTLAFLLLKLLTFDFEFPPLIQVGHEVVVIRGLKFLASSFICSSDSLSAFWMGWTWGSP